MHVFKFIAVFFYFCFLAGVSFFEKGFLLVFALECLSEGGKLPLKFLYFRIFWSSLQSHGKLLLQPLCLHPKRANSVF